MLKLYALTDRGNTYCGPTAISLLTGITTKHAAAMIRAHSGQTFVKGAASRHMIEVLRDLGASVTETSTDLRTLRKFRPIAGETYLLITRHHYVIVQGKYAVCSMTRGELVPRADHPHAGSRLRAAWIIKFPRGVVTPCMENIVTVRRPQDPARNKVMKLARQHDLLVERDGETIWVFPPDNANYVDPYDDEHFCYSWTEALTHAEQYAILNQRTAS